MAESSLMTAIRELFATFPPKLRVQLYGQLGLTILGALAELATIGAVIPFITLVASLDAGRDLGLAGTFIDWIAGASGLSRVEAAAAILILIALTAGAVRLLLNWMTQLFVFSIGFELSKAIYSSVLHQPYSYHLDHNSAQFISALQKVQLVIATAVLPSVQCITSLFVGTGILIALILVDPVIAISTAVGFAIIYAAVSVVTRTRVRSNSRIIADLQTSRIKLIQESLGGIRDVIIERAQPIFLKLFADEDKQLRRRQAINQFVAMAPRFVMEAGSVVVIALVAMIVANRPGGVVAALPILAAFGLGAQRLLPLAQQIYSSFTLLAGSQGSLADILKILRGAGQPELESGTVVPHVRFERNITLRGVSFSYGSDEDPALHSIDLVINRGSCVGLVGPTGSGKSTLVDVIMGLLRPSGGLMEIDGVVLDDAATIGWQSHIAHVPQAIYLADTSVSQNIAFGCLQDEIDHELVREVVRRARLDVVVRGLPEGLNSLVGEKGVRLSGGQRQRIGIARALYQRADVLVLDEATSALDEETEASVMGSIAELKEDLTVIIVAHRLSTLKMCDMIVRLDNGRIVEFGDFESMIGGSAEHGRAGDRQR